MSARVVLVTVLALEACEGVPTLTFPSADAAALGDAGDAALADDATPAVAPDATPDAGPAAEAGCPDEPPPGTTACCGAIACAGDCDAHCADCESKCAPVEACCSRNGGVSCHAQGFVCN